MDRFNNRFENELSDFLSQEWANAGHTVGSQIVGVANILMLLVFGFGAFLRYVGENSGGASGHPSMAHAGVVAMTWAGVVFVLALAAHMRYTVRLSKD